RTSTSKAATAAASGSCVWARPIGSRWWPAPTTTTRPRPPSPRWRPATPSPPPRKWPPWKPPRRPRRPPKRLPAPTARKRQNKTRLNQAEQKRGYGPQRSIPSFCALLSWQEEKGPQDAEMQRQHHRQPHEKTRLAGLVMEQPHPRQAAQRAPRQGKAQQGGLRDAPALAHRLPFVDAESRKGGQI